ncbi:MAG: response regulator [Candidatus Krumholzibacteriia bacterium]
MPQETMAFLEDIFFTAKIREVAKALSKEVRFVRDLSGLEKRLAGPPPEMVLIDLTAESLKPLELIRLIKEHPEWAGVRVVAYSSHSRAELMEEANQLGADIVLPKPGFAQKLPEILQGAVV